MQKLTIENLTQTLNIKELKNVYLLVGQEPLFITEACDLFYNMAKSLEIFDKYKWIIETKTNWNDIFNEMESFGLFSNKKLIHIILPETLSKDIQENLLQLSNLLHNDILLLLQISKLNPTIEKQNWLQHLIKTKEINSIDCNPIESNKLSLWIQQRANILQLNLDKEAINVLIYAYEGNLLALKQTLDFLKLLYPNSEITAPRVEEIAIESAVFKPYTWIDELFIGNIDKAIHILNSFQQEDFAPVILLRSIQRELQIIFDIMNSHIPHDFNELFPTFNLRAEYDRLKIWKNRREIYNKLFQRLTYTKMFHLWDQMMQIEKAIKIEFNGKEWILLEQLSLSFI